MNLFRFLFGIVVLVGLNNCGGSSGDEDTDILDTDLIDSTSVSSDVDDSIDDNNGIIEEDKTPPVITIFGDNPLVITQGETFSDPGATAVDNIDGEVAVTPIGSVDMSTAGSYNIIYTATDSAGNEANATRVVIVQPADVIWKVSNVSEFREALEDASANGQNDKIILGAGVYNTINDGLGTFKFNDNEEFNLTIEAEEGLSSNDVILDGNNSTQVFNFNNTKSSTLYFKGVSIVNGKTSSNYGGGIYSNQNINIKDCNISNNTSSYRGGGIYSDSNVTIDSSIIADNSVFDNYDFSGGGGVSSYCTKINNSTITNNKSIVRGGGVFSGIIEVKDSIITNNSSRYGGGINAFGMIIINSAISNNYASYAGGGLYISGDEALMVLTNSVFTENSAGSGAIYAIDSGTNQADFYVSNNTFINNKGYLSGKGVFINNIFSNNGDLDISLRGDSKFYNNYLDYTKMAEGSYNVIKKNNLQPSEVGEVYLDSDNQTPKSNSPVIDKGLNPSSATYKEIIGNDTIYNQILEELKVDKLGHQRIYNDTIDIGAVEYIAE